MQALPPGRADRSSRALSCWRRKSSCPSRRVDGHGPRRARPGCSPGAAAWPRAAARRSWPPRWSFAALTVMEQLGDATNTSLVGPFTSAFIVSYSFGANLEGRAAGRGRRPGWSRSSRPCRCSIRRPDEGLDLVWGWLVIVAAPVLAGRLLRDRARLARALRDGGQRASDAERAGPSRRWREERTRIAGELHDIVAHALRRDDRSSADGAGRLVDARARAGGAAFAAVEQTGREALAEMRAPARRPAPRRRRARARAAADPRPRRRPRRAARAPPACRVELRVEGDGGAAAGRARPHRLPGRPGGARAAPARRRAPPGARSSSATAPDAVELEVVDDGVAATGRRSGIAERVRSTAASCSTRRARRRPRRAGAPAARERGVSASAACDWALDRRVAAARSGVAELARSTRRPAGPGAR